MKLKVMTYNICSGKNMARERDLEYSASVIRDVQPDFVTLNEVRSHTSDVGPINQANELGRITGYYPVFGRSIDVMGGEYGNALLTRLPLISSEVIHIPDPEKEGEGFYEHRTVLKCILKSGATEFAVLCTHFGLMPGEQKNAVDTAISIINDLNMPVLLMGDLNLTPDAPALQPLMNALDDTSTVNPGLLTFPSDKPEIKIDYILHSAGITPVSLNTIDTQCSDHRPLIAEIEL
jgi:endonuclease/exonuclease/phosphatase family metal-dependent hydrolase